MTANKNYAGFWARSKATLIDGFILLPMIIFFYPWGYDMEKQPIEYAVTMGFDSLITSLLFFAYTVIMYAEYNGQTVGKRVAGIKVVMEDGSKLTYGKTILREIGAYTSAGIFLLGYFWVIWDAKKQGWHDKIAQTLVVKV